MAPAPAGAAAAASRVSGARVGGREGAAWAGTQAGRAPASHPRLAPPGLRSAQRTRQRVRHVDARALHLLHRRHARQLQRAGPCRCHGHHVAHGHLARQHVWPVARAAQRRCCCRRRAVAAPRKQVVARRHCVHAGGGGGQGGGRAAVGGGATAGGGGTPAPRCGAGLRPSCGPATPRTRHVQPGIGADAQEGGSLCRPPAAPHPHRAELQRARGGIHRKHLLAQLQLGQRLGPRPRGHAGGACTRQVGGA